MDIKVGAGADELFELFAERARELVREDIAEGRTEADIIVIIADCDDQVAFDFMRSAIPTLGFNQPDRPGGVLCATIGLEDVNLLNDAFPDQAKNLAAPVEAGDVLTVILTDGGATVYHLFMVQRDQDDSDDEIADASTRADELIEALKGDLVQEALIKLAEGKDAHEIVALIFDLDDRDSRAVASKIMPNLDLDSVAPEGASAFTFGMADVETVMMLAGESPGLEEALQKPLPPGSILVLVYTAGHVIAQPLRFESYTPTESVN